MGFSPQTRGRAFVAVVQVKNMEKMGLAEEQYKDPECLAEYLTALWENSGKNRTCAVAVCSSADGLYHAHMALYGNTTTLKAVSDILFQSHVEPQMGGKAQLTEYLMKQGKYEEKGESILSVKGIEKIQDSKGSRNDLEMIEEMLIKGMTPQQILDTNFKFYKYEKMILHAYTDRRIREAPVRQDVYVEYHVGDSGTGKTYSYNQLCEEHGAENIYILTDYDNNASGGLDSYMKSGAPPILLMDEYKGFGITYGKLLTMLNGYTRMQTHARFSNCFNLWGQVFLASVYPPEVLYQNMVPHEYQDIDSYAQLIRRISRVVYHYIEDGEYKTYSVDGREYTSYEDLKGRAAAQNRHKDGFRSLSSGEQKLLPFKER